MAFILGICGAFDGGYADLDHQINHYNQDFKTFCLQSGGTASIGDQDVCVRRSDGKIIFREGVFSS